MSDYIDKTISDLESYLVKLDDKVKSVRESIINLRQLFDRLAANDAMPVTVTYKEPKKTKPNPAKAPSRKGKSKYKGVCRTSDGRKWRAQIYIRGKGIKGLGTFETEEAAHQVYEDFKEQYENNPDRPKKTEKIKKTEDTEIERWKCVSCGLTFRDKKKPPYCVCGSVSIITVG